MTYIICEAGQNHNGSMEIAQQLIDMAAISVEDSLFGTVLPSANAIKFTKRDLNEELSQSQMNQLYNSPHSFGKTYGEHRAFLELDDVQHTDLYHYAKAKGLDFVETLCAKGCLSLLKHFSPDKLKVASRDLTNLPLLDAMAESHIPMILSTGMSGQKELDEALNVITKHHQEVSILHCLSEYPSRYENLNLNSIPYLQKQYPSLKIGYSDHSIGIVMPVAAVALGATMIEKHITLDRSMKGSDQAGSLEPDGLKRMVRDIRNLEKALGSEGIFVADAAKQARIKLERSVASLRNIAKGESIEEANLHLLSPGDGFKWAERDQLIGKTALVDIPANEVIYANMVD
jgi:sialic acid synthase